MPRRSVHVAAGAVAGGAVALLVADHECERAARCRDNVHGLEVACAVGDQVTGNLGPSGRGGSTIGRAEDLVAIDHDDIINAHTDRAE